MSYLSCPVEISSRLQKQSVRAQLTGTDSSCHLGSRDVQSHQNIEDFNQKTRFDKIEAKAREKDD
jgi:hypothetical protein